MGGDGLSERRRTYSFGSSPTLRDKPCTLEENSLRWWLAFWRETRAAQARPAAEARLRSASSIPEADGVRQRLQDEG